MYYSVTTEVLLVVIFWVVTCSLLDIYPHYRGPTIGMYPEDGGRWLIILTYTCLNLLHVSSHNESQNCSAMCLKCTKL
jgi:hypothetical protein